VPRGLRVRVARVERQMTQAELAEAVGVTRQTIGLIESGDYNPTLNLCLGIAHALDKTLDKLFWEDTDDQR
jgi:putative transcriptional regulator